MINIWTICGCLMWVLCNGVWFLEIMKRMNFQIMDKKEFRQPQIFLEDVMGLCRGLTNQDQENCGFLEEVFYSTIKETNVLCFSFWDLRIDLILFIFLIFNEQFFILTMICGCSIWIQSGGHGCQDRINQISLEVMEHKAFQVQRMSQEVEQVKQQRNRVCLYVSYFLVLGACGWTDSVGLFWLFGGLLDLTKISSSKIHPTLLNSVIFLKLWNVIFSL